MAEIGFVPMAAGGAVKSGAYTGDNAAIRTVNLGVTPKWVLVAATGSFNGFGYSGLALPDMPAVIYNAPTDYLVTIVSDGFNVYNSGSGGCTNQTGMQYYYLYGI